MTGEPKYWRLSKRSDWSPCAILVAFVLANICDSLSTFAGLSRGGIEANFLLSGLIDASSIPTALIIKVILALGFSILVVRWKPRVLVLPTLVLTLVTLSNTLITLAVL